MNNSTQYRAAIARLFGCPICEKKVELKWAILPVHPCPGAAAFSGTRLDTSKAPGILICPECHYWEPCNKDAISLRMHKLAIEECDGWMNNQDLHGM